MIEVKVMPLQYATTTKTTKQIETNKNNDEAKKKKKNWTTSFAWDNFSFNGQSIFYFLFIDIILHFLFLNIFVRNSFLFHVFVLLLFWTETLEEINDTYKIDNVNLFVNTQQQGIEDNNKFLCQLLINLYFI